MPARNRPLLSASDVAAMRRRYDSGESLYDLSVAFGVAKNTARRALLVDGVIFSKEGTRQRISKKAKGRPSHRKGITVPESSRQKMSATRKTRSYPPEAYSRVFSDETKKKMRESALRRWEENITRREAAKLAKPKRSREELAQVQQVREFCKRLVHRVLKATGRRKEIPSEQYLKYTKAEFLAALGPRPEGYELDHIVPVVEFVRRGIVDPAVINALCNLRFIPRKQNREKSDKLPDEVDNLVAQALAFSGGSYERYVA